MSNSSSVSFEDIASGNASPEEVEAYNERTERELQDKLDERIADLNEREEKAVDALVGDAQDSVSTTTVTLESGVELEVRSRLPQRVERQQQRLRRLETRDGVDTDRVAELNCEMLASICETDGYDSPEPWYIAYRHEDGGLQWLGEVTAKVLGPARERAEELEQDFQ